MNGKNDIETLKILLSNGYKVIKQKSYIMVDPNSESPLEVKLKKENDIQKLVFSGSYIKQQC